ncbi:MAG: MFS transporter [Patescibacteria group bacterium]
MPVSTSETKKNKARLLILYLLGLLLAISGAIPAYIQSNFLEQFVSVRTVSLFFAIANCLSVAAILLFPALIKNLGNYFLTKVTAALYLAALLGLTIADGPNIALISTILFSVTSNLIWINMDILVESFSDNRATGRIRTAYFTAINLGWIMSPLFSAYLISRGQYTLSFLIAAFMVAPFYLILVSQRRKLKDRIEYKSEALPETIKKMWRNRNLRGIFFVALLLSLFYSAAVIYVPLRLFQDLGMSWDTLGWIFSVMLVPFVLIEIPAGVIADKYLGEKEILFAGFAIIVISLLLFYRIATPNAWLWAAVLFASRVGAALVESMRETYFFKIVDADEVGYINIFRTTGPLGYIIGAGLGVLILSFFPLHYLFLFFALILLAGFGFIASIKDTK